MCGNFGSLMAMMPGLSLLATVATGNDIVLFLSILRFSAICHRCALGVYMRPMARGFVIFRRVFAPFEKRFAHYFVTPHTGADPVLFHIGYASPRCYHPR